MARPANLLSPRWPVWRDLRLEELWDLGCSISQIGEALGVSRNAVAGRRRRLALPGRPSPIIRLVNDNHSLTVAA